MKDPWQSLVVFACIVAIIMLGVTWIVVLVRSCMPAQAAKPNPLGPQDPVTPHYGFAGIRATLNQEEVAEACKEYIARRRPPVAGPPAAWRLVTEEDRAPIGFDGTQKIVFEADWPASALGQQPRGGEPAPPDLKLAQIGEE